MIFSWAGPEYAFISAYFFVSNTAVIGDAAFRGSAYALWLASHLTRATLVHGDTFDASFALFRHGHADVLAALMPKLLTDRAAWPGSRILEGTFMRVQQSVGTAMRYRGGADFVQQFVRHAKASGLVARLIEQHAIVGLKVAPAQAA